MGQAACAAVGTTTLFSSINSLGMLNALARPKPFAFPPVNDGYRAMVCVLLGGGNDSYNMLVPTTGEAYMGTFFWPRCFYSRKAIPIPTYWWYHQIR